MGSDRVLHHFLPITSIIILKSILNRYLARLIIVEMVKIFSIEGNIGSGKSTLVKMVIIMLILSKMMH